MGSTLTLRVVFALAVSAMLGACSSMQALIGSGDGTEGPFDADNLAYYVNYLDTFVSGDPPEQLAALNQARDDAQFAPTATNRLLYALALSVPGHAGSDAGEAADRLSDLLAAGNLLTREERMLAEIQLESASAIRDLHETNRNAEQRFASARSEASAEQEQQIANLEAENQTLRSELENVQTMLDAITNIERSLSEREDSDE